MTKSNPTSDFEQWFKENKGADGLQRHYKDVLNRILIDFMGIQGAALATLLVVALFSLLKLIYVSKKMKMQPFTSKTMVLLLIITIMFMIFYFIDLPFNAYLNILIKSSLITVIFVFLVIKLKLSVDMNLMIDRYFK